MYEKIISDPCYHFENSYVTNFDIIHNECRGDEMTHDKKFYNTICNQKLNDEITNDQVKTNFISNAINCESKDVFLKKKVLKEHFMRIKLEEKLEQNHVFLSSMKKRAFLKKNKCTDDCKSLFF